jgi:hypothetical protein
MECSVTDVMSNEIIDCGRYQLYDPVGTTQHGGLFVFIVDQSTVKQHEKQSKENHCQVRS